MSPAPRHLEEIQIDPATLPTSPSAAFREEEKNFEEGRKQDQHEQNIADQKHYRTLREKNADRSFNFLVGWVIFVGIIMLLQGFNGTCCIHFQLPESVLAILAGSAIANAIGQFAFVVKGLFKVKD